MTGGGAMADAFVNLGDKLHKNFNETFALATQQKDVVEKYKHLAEQLAFEKDKFGIQFALQKLQTMRGVTAQEKQLLLQELTAREGTKTSALKRQMAERQFRESVISQERKKAIGDALATGFAGAMKDNTKKYRLKNKSSFGGKFDPAQVVGAPQVPPQNTIEQQLGGMV